MTARFLISFFVLLFGPFRLEGAEEWEHFSYPPPGQVFVDIKNRKATTPIQIAGTLSPPTLFMNGKKIALQATDKKVPGPKLLVNDEEVSVKGKAGRFFYALSSDEILSGEIEVRLVSSDGSTKKGVIRLDHTFLERDFSQRLSIPEGSLKGTRFTFRLRGRIPDDAELKVQDGGVSKIGDGRVEVKKEISEGKSVIVATLHKPDGAKKVINIPVLVKLTRHQKNRIILGVKAPHRNPPYAEPWVIPYQGVRLSGVTNQKAKLKINETPVSILSNGRFGFSYVPSNKNEEIDFEVSALGKNRRFSKRVYCPNCKTKNEWYYPNFRIQGDQFLSFSPAGRTLLNLENGRSINNPMSVFLNLGYGYHLTQMIMLEPRLYYIPPLLFEGNAVVFVAGVRAYLLRVFSIGLAPSFVYASTPYGQTQSFSLAVNAGLRFQINKSWEFGPRITTHLFELASLSGSSVRTFEFIEPVVFRYYF